MIKLFDHTWPCFEFAGRCTNAIPGLSIERKGIFGVPERDVERIHVPGRDGDVLFDQGSYKNVTLSYDVAVVDYTAKEMLFNQILLGRRGYQLLRDSWGPWERMAVFYSAVNPKEALSNRLMRFQVPFDCKPQRYYMRDLFHRTAFGETNILQMQVPVIPEDRTKHSTIGPRMTRSQPWNNDRRFNASPRHELVGSGTVRLRFDQLGEITFTDLALPPVKIAATASQPIPVYEHPSVVIDCEAMQAYQYRANGTRFTIDLPFWPTVPADKDGFMVSNLFDIEQLSGSLTSFTVYPRWWRI